MTNENSLVRSAVHAAAELIAESDALIITSGAGIGIDSGLPDFRGENGFWNAYPALGNLGINFTQIANPKAFQQHPELAWGFYGHRLQLYRDTVPHEGFQRLLKLAEQMPLGLRHFTSNVDGQFQKAGFKPEHATQCHGSIHMLQCMDQCGQEAWPADDFQPVVDVANCKLTSALPSCPVCGGLARPNILMFGDWDFEGHRYEQSESSLLTWVARASRPVVIEIGAGTAIPSARHFGEELNCPLIRINPSESQVGLHRDISIPLGAKEALVRITDALNLS
ncbi:MAG: Sir2 family NAD-dependent protein deacetylase [Dehalococcoidales bacterium]|nr:Sir2 family NAD-dependent protein deacetylase [Dehalococcoidales bacterium]